MPMVSQIETSIDRNIDFEPSQSCRRSAFPSGRPKMDTARGFCQQVVTLGVLGLLCVATLNFLVDPYAQYGSRFVAPVVQPSRAEKVDLLSVESSDYDSMVVGSSRVMKLEPNCLNEKFGSVFFNAGVNRGKPEDYLALKRLFSTIHGRTLKTLVIGVDEVSFLADATIDARLISHPQLVSQVHEALSLPGRFLRWQQLLGWQQTIASIKTLEALWGNRAANLKQSFQRDGLLIYHERERQLADGSYDFGAAIEYNKLEYVSLMQNYGSLSSKRMELFRLLLAECQLDGTEVIVFTTPLHPALRTHLLAQTDTYLERHKEMIGFVSAETNAYGGHFVDLTSLDIFNGNADDFVDGIHPLEANTRKIIDRLWRQSRGGRRHAVQ